MDFSRMTPKADGRAGTLVVGFVALVIFIAVVAIAFALAGVEPARETGPLPFVVE